MDIRWADPCARIFRMDPCLIYSKESFLRMLPEAVANAQQEVDEAWEAFKSIRRIHVRIPDYIQDIKSAAGPRAICRVIAENIKEKGLDSIVNTVSVVEFDTPGDSYSISNELLLSALYSIKDDVDAQCRAFGRI